MIEALDKDLYNEEHLRDMGLNERQIRAVLYVKDKWRIINKVYLELNNCSKPTATRDLSRLVSKGILEQTCSRGKRHLLHAKGSERRQKDIKKRELNGG